MKQSTQLAKTTGQRQVYVDLLRLAAAAAVVFVHTGTGNWVTPTSTLGWQLDNLWKTIFQWPVGLFVMISGIFHLRPAGDIPLAEDFRNMLRKIWHVTLSLIVVGGGTH
jgi:surface polysaccharide O-acyltransferase-like enzyme